ncbi:hypothetical protein RhiirA4_472936 [Rhizophagus irregularis]|uniref:Uncharacterized protein n=1 Tax=Rhizophagus irregularis TaxID=588596 RepID=A0A2I1H5U2_9GLOM|nr:hypothetical protein RhiirA4_472936 [Rhizophagus irregularis]
MEHYGLNYIHLTYSIIYTLWENEDFTLDLSRLEGLMKNKSCDADKKKIGKKGDGIFSLKGDRLEIGGIEAGN